MTGIAGGSGSDRQVTRPETVYGRTTCSVCRQLVHSRDSKTGRLGSISISRGRG